MADTKITALTALTAADPSTDVLPIVDTSDTTMAASGTTKKISINNILGASGTATLASATISGDLTVDTSTLKVDSANNRVGVGTASPLGPFHLVTTAAGFSEAGYFENSQAVGANVGPRVSLLGAGSVAMSLIQSGWNAAANTDAYLAFLTRGSGGVTERYRIASDGVATWSNVGGVAGTAMTLNSTGLGLGVSPAANTKLYVRTVALTDRPFYSDNGVNADFAVQYGSNLTTIGCELNTPLAFKTNNVERLRIDTSGNVGIGVTSPATKLDVAGNARVQLAFFTGGAIPGLTNDNPFAYRFPGGGLGLGAATETGTASPIIFYTGEGGVERVRVKGFGQVRFFPLAADPSGAEAGDVYYNSTSNKLKCYNGTTWNDLF